MGQRTTHNLATAVIQGCQVIPGQMWGHVNSWVKQECLSLCFSYDQILIRGDVKEEGFILTPSLKMDTIVSGMAERQEWDTWPHCVYNQEAESREDRK